MSTKRNKHARFNMVLILAAFVVTVAVLATADMLFGSPDLHVGQVAPRDYIATREVENVIATNRLRKAAADSVKEIFAQDPDVNERVLNQLGNFFEQAYNMRKDYVKIFNPYEDEETPAPTERTSLSVYLTGSQRLVLLEMDTDSYNALERDLALVMEKLLEQGIRDDSREKALVQAKEELERFNLSGDVKNLAYEIISSYIEPNLFIDEAATTKAKEDKAAEVAPVMFKQGQSIIRANDIINEEVFAVLDDLGFTDRSYAESVIPAIGSAIIVLIVFIISILYIRAFFPELSQKPKEATLLISLYLFIILISRFLSNIPYLFVPILIFTILVSILLNSRLAFFLNLSVTVICLLIVDGGMDFFVFFLISGSAGALLGQYATERNKIIVAGIMLSAVNVCVVTGYMLFFENNYTNELVINIAYAVLAGLLSVILSVGSLPFWEAVFGIITPVKLMDLSNPNNELLRRLMIEAPGTYQHSLIVANLAETAAYDIGANTLAARAGGYYHDIGKLKYPQYFGENQAGVNPHDEMDPYSSAQVILSHVGYGLELAVSHKLPRIIEEMISQHHGTTLIKYFYYNAKKLRPDEEVNEDEFRYNYQIPSSREAALVMLADTTEAAVRSMAPSGKPLDEVEKFVRVLIKDKLDDGQLASSGLKIMDLDTIAVSFMRVFKGMYHERIPYPTAPKK